MLDPAMVRPLKRAEYDQLVAAGAFENERVELLEGMVVKMNPKGPPHEDAIQELNRLLVLAVVGRATVRIQSSFAASDRSEPEPDLAVVPLGRYKMEHPKVAYLVIEVADSSLAHDRNVKAPVYAAAGVPEYWIVNLIDGVIEVSTHPKAGAYTKTQLYRRGTSITPSELPYVTIAVDDIIA
jgi:Uma2 family endonuclease